MNVLCWLLLFAIISEVFGVCSQDDVSNPENKTCFMGECVNNTCVCFDGWGDTQCDTCLGRIQMNESNGYIFDGPRNYSHASKCSWLVKPSARHSSLRLRFIEFATECGWDHLYIYDGDSAFSPLIGAFNGLLHVNDSGQETEFPPEIIAQSGTAFIHFFSDAAYSMVGFNISYSVDECQNDCYQRGNCSDSTCVCANNYTGRQCNLCDCSATNTTLQCLEDTCTDDTNDMNRWSVLEFDASELTPRASCSLTAYQNTVLMYGGFKYDTRDGFGDLAVFDTNNRTWRVEEVMNNASSKPELRYEHTTVFWNNSLIVFGGKLSENERTVDQVWRYDFATFLWNLVPYTSDFGQSSTPGTNPSLQLAGHSANLVTFANGTQIMVILCGYHPTMGFSSFIYEYNPSTLAWTHPRTKGAIIRGIFGHTSVYDPVSNLIYVHGGMQYGGKTSSHLTSQTLSYNPDNREILILNNSRRPRYLHSSVFLNGVMYIYGGSIHNEPTPTALCYSSDFMAYYPNCDMWVDLSSPPVSLQARRYGHQSVIVSLPGDDSKAHMYIFSGYDSTMIANLLVYDFPSCSDFKLEATCNETYSQGLLCSWNSTHCINYNQNYPRTTPCQGKPDPDAFCPLLDGHPCATCTANAYGCKICNNGKCAGPSASGCNETCSENQLEAYCNSLFSCEQCNNAPDSCKWVGRCVSITNPGNSSTCDVNTTCDSASTCEACNGPGRDSCMWCLSLERCINTNSYVLQFPYGQCMEWTRSSSCPSFKCTDHQTCTTCQNYTRCGWCDDGSMTGIGRCEDGSGRGPMVFNSSTDQYAVDHGVCSAQSWFFTSCPRCQCNGHSQCDEDFSCLDCKDDTAGENCEVCADGFFGNSLNGGNCSECDCGGKALNCNPSTGSCFCSTKGEIGDTCEKCDVEASYFGNAQGNGTCFYTIQENFIFTFTLTPRDDEHITSINFQNQPGSSEDVELSLVADAPCNVRLAVISNFSLSEDDAEVTLMHFENVTSVKYTFDGDTFKFGEMPLNSTIRIYVSNFSVRFQVRVSLIQYNNALLILLLIIFSTLLAALIVGAVIWKLKLMWDVFRARSNRAIQMKEMAARPFAGISLHCDDIYRSTKALLSPDSYNMIDCDGTPDIFCEETCEAGNASVASVFLWLPSNVPSDKTQGEETNSSDVNASLSSLYLQPPPGQSALAIGTVLVSHKNTKRRQQRQPVAKTPKSTQRANGPSDVSITV